MNTCASIYLYAYVYIYRERHAYNYIYIYILIRMHIQRPTSLLMNDLRLFRALFTRRTMDTRRAAAMPSEHLLLCIRSPTLWKGNQGASNSQIKSISRS